MKNALFLAALVVAATGLTSCEKCTDCTCTGNISFEFDSSIPEETQQSLRETYTTAYEGNYPDESIEICEKRKDFKDEVKAYENKTETYEEHQTSGGAEYHVTYVYTCTCED